MAVKIADLKESAFDDDGAEYVDFREILDVPLEVTRVIAFENDKGKGVAAWFKKADGSEGRICTHSIGITDVLGSDAVQDVLAAGESVEMTIRKKRSSKSGREFFYVE